MRGGFTEIISASVEWTKTVLFRPFSIKKWLLLYFIALLAFQLQGGFNLKMNRPAPQSGRAMQSARLKTNLGVS